MDVTEQRMAARLIACVVMCAALCGCDGREQLRVDEFDPMYVAKDSYGLAVRVSVERMEYLETESAGIEKAWESAKVPEGPAGALWAANGLRFGVVESGDVEALKRRLGEVRGAQVVRSEVSSPGFDTTIARRPGTSVFFFATGDARNALDVSDLRILARISILGTRDDPRLVVTPAWSAGRGPVQALAPLSVEMPASEKRVYMLGPSDTPPEMSMGWTLAKYASRDAAGSLLFIRLKLR